MAYLYCYCSLTIIRKISHCVAFPKFYDLAFRDKISLGLGLRTLSIRQNMSSYIESENGV